MVVGSLRAPFLLRGSPAAPPVFPSSYFRCIFWRRTMESVTFHAQGAPRSRHSKSRGLCVPGNLPPGSADPYRQSFRARAVCARSQPCRWALADGRSPTGAVCPQANAGPVRSDPTLEAVWSVRGARWRALRKRREPGLVAQAPAPLLPPGRSVPSAHAKCACSLATGIAGVKKEGASPHSCSGEERDEQIEERR